MDHSDRSSRLRPVGLEDEYDLLSELRHGEASSTWLAHERAAHRDVVITIVRPHGLPRRELLAEIGADQQMLAARRTAGVVPVLGLHWLSDGSLAIIRPRVRGTTLAQLLQSTGALPLDRAVGILREIGEQLDWARRIGIRHRELGADSVCFQQGNGRVLLSFGPAPVLGESIDREAPAAAAYEPILSRCSDTATLGRLAWEMLTTRPAPVHGDAGAMSARRGYREPGLADLRPDLPLSVAADVESALRCERDPAPRGPVAFIASLAAAAGQGAAPARGMEPAPHVAPVPSPVLQRHDLQSYAEPSPWTTPVAAAPVVAQPPKRRRRGAVVMAFTVLAALVLAVSAMLLRDADAPGDRRASRASEATPRVSTGDVEFDRSGVDTGVLVDPNGSARPAQRPPQPAPPAGATNAPTVFAPPGTTPAPVATGDPCASEAAAAQQRCLRERIAETDVQLNRTYQSLFRELRTDPAQAARLRADQREWLARRDAECRSRVGQSGTWAPAFAQCVGEISSSRARELEAELARRRGGI